MADPLLKGKSLGIEGATHIQQAMYIPFHGGINVVNEPAQLPLGTYSSIVNMRPKRPGLEKRKGCIRLHSIADN